MGKHNNIGNNIRAGLRIALTITTLLFLFDKVEAKELWKVTAYCSCVKCCGKSDSITASGHKTKYGYVACNWLPFGTLIEIKGMGVFKVMDRGAKSLFGSRSNNIKHVDIWLASHSEARRFGVKWLEVRVIKQ